MHANHPVEIHNDLASLRFLMEQPKLTAKQTRWIAFLSTFAELRFVHVRGSSNTRADALSRRADHDVGTEQRQQIRSDIAKQQLANVFQRLGVPNARINTLISEVSAGDTEISDAIVNGYNDDTSCRKILSDPARYGYRLRWDLLERVDDGSILVPATASLRSRILRHVHDGPTSGHLGINKTYHRLITNYHWPNAWIDVADYVRSCDACQRAKPRPGKTPGLSQSIEPQHKAHTIALDFLGPLQMTSRGNDTVLVITDAFTKRVYLEAIHSSATSQQVAQIIVNRVVRHQGVPRCIRSDRDARFTSKLWSSIWSELGAEIKLTTAFHHEANGQPERFMLTLSNSLRAFCNTRGTDWDTKLIACELAYNTAQHSATGLTPIEVDIGIKARLPIDLTRKEGDHKSRTPTNADMIHDKEIAAFRSILEAQSRNLAHNNLRRRDEHYVVGDSVLIETANLAELNAPGAKKLRSRWSGPYMVVEAIGDVNVKLKLPDSWNRVHPVFHVSRLRRAHIRDEERFPNDQLDNLEPIGTHESESVKIDSDLSEYNQRGAAIAQIEHDLARANRSDNTSTSRTMTRSSVQQAHDRGDRYDYLQL